MSELLQIVRRVRRVLPVETPATICPHCGKRVDESVTVVPPADHPATVAITEPAEQKVNPVDAVPEETVAASLANVQTKKSRAKAASH